MKPDIDWQLWKLAGMTVVAVFLLILRVLPDSRRRELKKIALSLGFSFEPDAITLPSGLLDTVPLFKRGKSGRVSNLLYKNDGYGTLFVLDYVCDSEDEDGSRKDGWPRTVALFPFSRNLPYFQLYPENLGHKIKQLFGCQDIDFADSPEFSRQYLLRGPDEAAVRKVFSVEARNMLSGMPGWHVEGSGEWLAVYKGAGRQRPENYQDYIKQAGDISSVFGGPRA